MSVFMRRCTAVVKGVDKAIDAASGIFVGG